MSAEPLTALELEQLGTGFPSITVAVRVASEIRDSRATERDLLAGLKRLTTDLAALEGQIKQRVLLSLGPLFTALEQWREGRNADGPSDAKTTAPLDADETALIEAFDGLLALIAQDAAAAKEAP